MGYTANFNQKFIDELIRFRKHLHKHPELSGQEKYTPQLVMDFLQKKATDNVLLNLGGTGLAIIYDSTREGPTTLFRCELDALPIKETNSFDYSSATEGVSHKCGHDGHMTIVAGLGKLLNEHGPARGKVILLFQPAEETGKGAEAVLKDKKFSLLQPDYCYALHNVPELEKGTVFIKSGTFSAASRGMIIKLHGATAHAAEPENGKSPALAMAEIIRRLTLLAREGDFKSLTLVTVVHALLGEVAFGVSPGYAEIRATLRTYLEEDMAVLIKSAEVIVQTISKKEEVSTEITYTEIFPQTNNNEEAVSVIKHSADQSDIPLKTLSQPFKWSEDFGHFMLKYKGAMLALGAGLNTPKLHNHDYDFPDELIATGVRLFHNIVDYHNR